MVRSNISLPWLSDHTVDKPVSHSSVCPRRVQQESFIVLKFSNFQIL